MSVYKIKGVLAVVLIVGLALGGIGVGVGPSTNPVAVAQAETPKEAPVKKESPASPVATKNDGEKGSEAKQVEAKDKPFVVHAVLESVDAKGAVITAKWVKGNDAGSIFRLFVWTGDLNDARDGLPIIPKNEPKLMNIPVRSDAKIVSGKERLQLPVSVAKIVSGKETTLQLKDLRAGSVVSLQLEADRVKGFVIVGIGVVEKP